MVIVRVRVNTIVIVGVSVKCNRKDAGNCIRRANRNRKGKGNCNGNRKGKGKHNRNRRGKR